MRESRAEYETLLTARAYRRRVDEDVDQVRDGASRYAVRVGVVQVQPTGGGAQISATLAHEGDAVVFGLTLEGIV